MAYCSKPSVFLLLLLVVTMAARACAQSCLTSSASSLTSDATTCVAYLQGLTSSCCQTAGPDGGCTNVCTSGTAAVAVCGPINTCIACSTAGNSAAQIVSACNETIAGANRVTGIISSTSAITVLIQNS